MKRLLLILSLVVLGTGLSVSDAEAKRLGGGRSVGMQRDMSSVRPMTPPAQTAPSQVGKPAPMTNGQAAPSTPKRSWMGPFAGLAAGLGIGALLSSMGMSGAMEGLMNVLLFALAGVLIFKLIARFKAKPAPEEPLHYAGVGGPNLGPVPIPEQQLGRAAAPPAQTLDTSNTVPADFDQDNFLRVAKVNFIRLQAAFDAANLDDLREFTSPELFAEIRIDLQARGAQKQTTDVVTLNAELIDLQTEAQRHVATVRFTGLLREEENGTPTAISELWHLTKPADGSRGWTVAGIQQA